MRIPLDYYRILGLPLAASEEQLRQAYSDRRQQRPRREYSHAAITSRKQLIEEAYVVLSNPKERKAYDRLYLSHAYAPELSIDKGLSPLGEGVAVEEARTQTNLSDRDSLSIEINASELVGALLILQELGEYEQVLELGRPYLVNHFQHYGSASHTENSTSTLDEATSDIGDIVLTVALACLELGREQWQQGNYENAAISLETGEELLGRDNLFASVQAEIRADLYRLRPYRILELLALPEEKVGERKQGLQLLQGILNERGGLDGTGEDYSGLNVDDFLRFIQQLRNYLTVAEQQQLFEAESKRPSSVATYLAVYALIARGFSQRQPALIRQAKQMLLTLSKRQDVHLEQSLCSLLLGQTEPASRALELSQEYEALAYIREHSQNSPDLLPGLCLYSERWLQEDVFPHFRDLTSHSASLKEYFADSQVQSYLEALPVETETTSPAAAKVRNLHQNRNFPTKEQQASPYGQVKNSEVSSVARAGDASAASYSQSQNRQNRGWEASSDNVNSYGTVGGGTATSTQTRRSRPLSTSNPTSVIAPPRPPRVKTRRRVVKRSGLAAKTKLLLMLFGSLAGAVLLWLLLSTAFGWLRTILTPAPAIKGEPLGISLNQAPLELPKSDSQPQYPEGKLTKESATDVIQTWLTSKSAALGPNHEVESLKNILTGPALKFWYNKALSEKKNNRYRQYTHRLISLDSLDVSDKDIDNAAVEATVNESAQYYQNNRQDGNNSYNDTVKVRYTLVREQDTWRIREMSLLSSSSAN